MMDAEIRLAAAIKNLQLAYALAKRLQECAERPELVQVAAAELMHLSSPYNIKDLGHGS